MPLLFNAQDVIRNFDDPDYRRGRVYQSQGHVLSVHVEDSGTRVVAEVQGTESRPYDVEVALRRKPRGIEIHAECTCPVGYMCKHGVAALLEAIAQADRKREKIAAPGLRGGGHGKTAATLSPALTSWLDKIEDHAAPHLGPDEEQRLVYLLGTTASGRKTELIVTPGVIYRLKNGIWSKPRIQSFQNMLFQYQHASFLEESDRAVFRLASASSGYGYGVGGGWQPPADPELVDVFLRRVMATGRAYDADDTRFPLLQGADLEGRLTWELMPDGRQRPTLTAPQAGLTLLMSHSPWYIDPVAHVCGRLRSPLTFDQTQSFLDAPPVSEGEAAILRAQMEGKKLAVPAPYRVTHENAAAAKPQPRLRLSRTDDGKGFAALSFDYEGTTVHPGDPTPRYAVTQGDSIVLRQRNRKAEAEALKTLEAAQLVAPEESPIGATGLRLAPAGSAPPWFWLDFLHQQAEALEQKGIAITPEENFGGDIVTPDTDDIDAAFTQNGEWWFALDLGIAVNGQRLALLPVLVALLRDVHTPADVDRLTSGPRCYAPLPDGRHVALPSERVRTILQTLIELFGDKPLDADGNLRVSMDLAAALLKIQAVTRHRWLGEGKLRKLVEKLGDFDGIAEAPLPRGLQAELRHYQKEGYDWLHFLGTYGLGGILADDMGLGKTVQALAYILALKEKKKLEHPCLVVMPTSLVGNWQAEAARFTPTLRILTLHGKDRFGKFEDVTKADVVLSTYPLLVRDIDTMREWPWGLVILDEAQAIKNPTAKITQAVCALQAKQRLCLTGTPVENHLGEVWSLFAFLMPGLLGDHRSFTRSFRNPIEKNGDIERQNLLTRRLKPFILRRLKGNVAKELPPKTEMVRRVTLSDDQRDLYETVRHTMNEKVRAEVAAKGFARSQIVILDALLKLRQVCCDPRLVKITAASKVKSCAKLTELMEMLPTLIEDGRRILLFSQFTSMLDLIKPELDKAEIAYVELRGTTKDRTTPVAQFQRGDVPLFLISLKAGGTGLNLTAADTVIHYDPWWNPSVENQATDRAHRIGQDKPVFVYKLIAEGTVEERILDLQARKAHLAGALFGDNPAAAAALTQDDLRWLLDET